MMRRRQARKCDVCGHSWYYPGKCKSRAGCDGTYRVVGVTPKQKRDTHRAKIDHALKRQQRRVAAARKMANGD